MMPDFMLRTHLLLALRHMRKNAMISALNLLGLSAGIAATILLALYIHHEYSFDRYHSKSNRIWRVCQHAFWNPEKPVEMGAVPNALGPSVVAEAPAIEAAARVLHHGFGALAFIRAGDNKFTEKKLCWADPALTAIFDIPVLEGNLNQALSEPQSVAVSSSTAKKCFGTATGIVGKILYIDKREPFKINAVYADFPTNSSFDANILGSFISEKWANERLTWDNSSFETWLLLKPDARPQTVENQLATLLDKHVPKNEQRYSFYLKSLKDSYMASSAFAFNDAARVGDPAQVRLLGWLALVVLTLACFNYMNLATANAQLQFREVGIAKTLGATRTGLAVRFLTETGLLTLGAALIGILLAAGALPFFNNMAEKSLRLSALLQPELAGWLAVVLALTALLAGSYPAFYLSGYKPKGLLHTDFRIGTAAGNLRRALVIGQFAAAVALMGATLVLYRQMAFLRSKNLGFEPDRVVAFNTAMSNSRSELLALMDELRQLPGVLDVCRMQSLPGEETSQRTLTKDPSAEEGLKLFTCRTMPGFEKVLNLNLLAGGTVPDKADTDTTVQVVITRKAADYLGYTPESALSKKIHCQLGANATIVGVVEDFHHQSLHNPMEAMAFHNDIYEYRHNMVLKLGSGDLPQIMQGVEMLFKKYIPNAPLEYRFLDAYLDRLYRRDAVTGKVVFIFCLISILIACLGLFGLSAFAAARRTKELSIRKVLGASVAHLTGLLTVDFLKLILVSVALGCPVAWYFSNRWLEDFAFRTEVPWWVFPLTGVAAAFIGLLTASFHSLKAAVANPMLE